MNRVVHALARTATNAGLLADVWSPWSILDSAAYQRLHAALVTRLPRREALPIAELDAATATRASVLEASADFTRPLVVRGALAGMTCLTQWGEPGWWRERYPDTDVLCSSAGGSRMLPVREALARPEVYVAGAATIFERHPELRDMVENDLTRAITPDAANNPPKFYQLFLGRQTQGTTVHCAIGINLFRQIAGRKKWYFIAPDQTPFLRAKIYANGYSATSGTIQPHAGNPGSPWFDRLERYTVTLEPGDLLVNPPWWWHCVENLPGDGLIVGVPTRFAAGRRVLRVDRFKTAVAVSRLIRGRSGIGRGGEDPAAFERSLIENRDETDQQLVLVPERLAPVEPRPVDWADRSFAEFRRLVASRPMILALALEFGERPAAAELRTGLAELVRAAPRLRCTLERSGAALRWIPYEGFAIDEHLRETVDEEVVSVEDLLRPAPLRLGRGLDWQRPLWSMELVRNHRDPARASFHGLRLRWDHALTDMEGMYLGLLELAGATPTFRPRPGTLTEEASMWPAVLQRLLRGRARRLALGPGTLDVAWTRVQLDVPVRAAESLARARGVSTRELLIACSAQALRAYRGGAFGFDVLAPSYSARPPDGPLELGNHHRRAARFSIAAEHADLEAILADVGEQARRAQPVSYAAAKLLSRAPDRLARRLLSRLPPVIVNWDDSSLSAQLSRLAGAAVVDFAVATPLLPHQHCSFIWWARDGDLRCSITAEREFVADVDALGDALRGALQAWAASGA